MNKKRVIAIISAIAVVAALFVGCAKKTDNSSSSGETKTGTKIKVGLSTDEGGLNDKSFNQAADTGIKKAVTDFGVDYKAVESKTKDDYEPNLNALISNGDQLVFGVGFQMGDALKDAAEKNTKVDFAIIDSVVSEPNVVSYNFKANESSFLEGVIAGKMTKSNKVGFIGGKDMELINAFEVGYTAGVKSVNPSAEVKIVYVDSFNDAAKGKESAKNLMDAGCDVIYHAAGGVGEGMFQAIKDAKTAGKAVWGIGVDMDQAVTLPQYADIILSSAVKRVDKATYDATKNVVNGTFKGNTNVVLGLKEGGVDISDTTSKNTPKDVLDLVAKYKQAIIDGKVKVPATKDEGKSFTPTAIQ
jgi:Uncharacterized ABC-type transport system, periplasmic component/surface lipoprotein